MVGAVKGGSKAQGNIHSQKPGVDLTGTVEQGTDFSVKVTPSIKFAYPTRNPRGEDVDIDLPDDAPIGSFRLGC